MDIDGDRSYRREGQFVDPRRTLAVAAVIDGFVDGIFVPTVNPVTVGQIGRAVIGNALGFAGMAIVADAFVLKDLAPSLDCGGIFGGFAQGSRVSADILVSAGLKVFCRPIAGMSVTLCDLPRPERMP